MTDSIPHLVDRVAAEFPCPRAQARFLDLFADAGDIGATSACGTETMAGFAKGQGSRKATRMLRDARARRELAKGG